MVFLASALRYVCIAASIDTAFCVLIRASRPATENWEPDSATMVDACDAASDGLPTWAEASSAGASLCAAVSADHYSSGAAGDAGTRASSRGSAGDAGCSGCSGCSNRGCDTSAVEAAAARGSATFGRVARGSRVWLRNGCRALRLRGAVVRGVRVVEVVVRVIDVGVANRAPDDKAAGLLGAE